MQEIWKDVVGYENLYQVSNLGNVRSLHYSNSHNAKNLSLGKHKNNIYLTVNLTHNGVTKTFSVHVLVATAFLPNPEHKPCVNHIDGNKLNNNSSNLEWVTHKENTRHAIKTGLKKNTTPLKGVFGAEHPTSKKVLQFTKSGDFIKEWDCMSTAADYYGFNPCMITNCCAMRTKSAKGYIWRYAEK